MVSDDSEKSLQAQVRAAHHDGRPLHIIGGASKSFYGRPATGAPLYTAAHSGVIDYDPAELVVTARAGTRLAELEELLGAKNQMPGFEPPRFSDSATIGGAVAAGLAGPRRPYTGAVRDFVLGVKMLNGKGEMLRFGGQVMKNVAGFDIARLMAGAMGTLGVLLEVSLRVIPQPQCETTLVLAQPDPAEAVGLFNRLAGRPMPLSAAAWLDGEARIRLSGGTAGVADAVRSIGGEADPAGDQFWRQLREHELPFFRAAPMLRLSIPPAAGLDDWDRRNPGQLIDWGGAQRWIGGDADLRALRDLAARHGGHLSRFRHAGPQDAGRDDVFHPLAPPLHALHRRLKHAFDPSGILNPGRLYRNL